jgi:acyl-CoA synthetase (AMP-forming)/AMP-acid ligase II
MPLFHVAGAIDCCLSPLTAGSEVLLPTAAGLRNPEVVAGHWRMVERFRPTFIGGTPTSLVALLNVQTNGADLSSLRFCFAGAALLSAALSDAFAKHVGVRVHQAYGMTECTGLITVAGAHAVPIAGTVGSALPGVDVCARRVLADGKVGERLPPGESGLLVVRGPNVFPASGNKRRRRPTRRLCRGDTRPLRGAPREHTRNPCRSARAYAALGSRTACPPEVNRRAAGAADNRRGQGRQAGAAARRSYARNQGMHWRLAGFCRSESRNDRG